MEGLAKTSRTFGKHPKDPRDLTAHIQPEMDENDFEQEYMSLNLN